MKYRFLYQTRDNRTVEDVVEAANRADAYARIRKRGIRPLRVIGDDPKPVRSWRRWTAIAVLALVCALSVSRVVRNGKGTAPSDSERRQILGDQAIIEVNARTGWARCFSAAGDRTLAAYAQPGWEVDRAKLSDAASVAAALETDVEPTAGDPMEFRQIKMIVRGMKDELRAYLADGGTLEGYLERLHERQLAEVGCYERAAQDFSVAEHRLGEDALYELWLKLNAGLREMGVRTLPMPEKLAK